MKIEAEAVRAYRLRVYHLDRRLPACGLKEAAGACGLQNSPPGAWETAAFNRVEGYTPEGLRNALYREKELLQAWSCRGVPMVFPTEQSDIFLSPLIARDGEQPWVYTRGITAGLDFVQMTFEELLPLAAAAAGYLDNHTIKSKELLDRTLARLVGARLPREKRALWDAPSMYGSPDRQTVGGAIVSFLLRPCSFSSLVVFGEREGTSPTFTSFENWTGHAPIKVPEAERELTRKFLRCYGPATAADYRDWLGCSPRQAERLWNSAADELEPVEAEGRACWMLASDMEGLRAAGGCGDRLILLGPHDPYLDRKDKAVILEDKARSRAVWKTVGNPGVILKGGRIVGLWKGKTARDRLELSATAWEPLTGRERRTLEDLAEEYAASRRLRLVKCAVERE